MMSSSKLILMNSPRLASRMLRNDTLDSLIRVTVLPFHNALIADFFIESAIASKAFKVRSARSPLTSACYLAFFDRLACHHAGLAPVMDSTVHTAPIKPGISTKSSSLASENSIQADSTEEKAPPPVYYECSPDCKCGGYRG